ncbi:hypothetical protein PVAP13_7NG241817 [Panicum virgatum]|uniref:Uncharacterized protein n=1 Tax=Panicum virgatum TaxID=38727 RepID=A0A8T0PYU6_PANVG|nr:hypothetical protein PVAP13_7NG241817 [Panicum virgatum]
MALAARADGVISMEIAGDYRDKLEVVGDGVDAACLVSCLRRKLGHAEILQVEEVKDKPQEDEATKENTMTAHYSRQTIQNQMIEKHQKLQLATEH